MVGEELVSFLSSDGKYFEVPKPVAAMILVTKPCDVPAHIDGGGECSTNATEAVVGADHEHQLGKVPTRVLELRSSILFKVIEYCNYHATKDFGQEEKCEADTWDQKFIDKLDNQTIIGIGMAAEDLKINELQKLAGRKVTELFPVLRRWGISDHDVLNYEFVNTTYKSILQKKLADIEIRERALRAMIHNPVKEPEMISLE